MKLIQAENEKSRPSVFKIWFYSRSDVSDYFAKHLNGITFTGFNPSLVVRLFKCKFLQTDDEEDNRVNGAISESENEESSEEDETSPENYSEKVSQLQKYVLNQNVENIFKALVEFEAENIKKLK